MSAAEAAPAGGDTDEAIPVSFFLRGEVVTGGPVLHRSRDLGISFATPEIDLDALVSPRSEPPPLLDVPLCEIMDFLVECVGVWVTEGIEAAMNRGNN